MTLDIHFRYFCPKCVSPTTCKVLLSQEGEEGVWFIRCPLRQVVMPQLYLREIEERHRPKPERTVDHSPMATPTPRPLSPAKQTQPKDVDKDDELDDEDNETPKDDKVGDCSTTDQAQDAGNSHTHTHTPDAHTPGDMHTHTHTPTLLPTPILPTLNNPPLSLK